MSQEQIAGAFIAVIITLTFMTARWVRREFQ